MNEKAELIKAVDTEAKVYLPYIKTFQGECEMYVAHLLYKQVMDQLCCVETCKELGIKIDLDTKVAFSFKVKELLKDDEPCIRLAVHTELYKDSTGTSQKFQKLVNEALELK